MRFSLKTLILATVILCVAVAGFGWLGFVAALLKGRRFGANVLLADNSVEFLPSDFPSDDLEDLMRADRRGHFPPQPRVDMLSPLEVFLAWFCLAIAFLGYFALRRKEAAARRSGGSAAD